MKTIRKITAVVIFLMCANLVLAQEEADLSPKKHPKWISDNGFWVVESNIHTPKNAIVRFYTNNGELVYTERLDGIKLNTNKRKTLMKLKSVTDRVVLAWEKNGVVKEQGELMAVLGNKR